MTYHIGMLLNYGYWALWRNRANKPRCLVQAFRCHVFSGIASPCCLQTLERFTLASGITGRDHKPKSSRSFQPFGVFLSLLASLSLSLSVSLSLSLSLSLAHASGIWLQNLNPIPSCTRSSTRLFPYCGPTATLAPKREVMRSLNTPHNPKAYDLGILRIPQQGSKITAEELH